MKKIVITMLALSMLAAFTACGETKTNNVTPSENGAAAGSEAEVEKEAESELAAVAIGDKITTDFAEITVDEIGIKEDIKISVTNGNITHTTGPSTQSGTKFVYVRGTMKSTAKSEISRAEFYGNADIDGYTYEIDSSIIDAEGYSTYSISPLMTYTYTLYARVPNELADSHESCVVNFGFNENFEQDFDTEISDCDYGYSAVVA